MSPPHHEHGGGGESRAQPSAPTVMFLPPKFHPPHTHTQPSTTHPHLKIYVDSLFHPPTCPSRLPQRVSSIPRETGLLSALVLPSSFLPFCHPLPTASLLRCLHGSSGVLGLNGESPFSSPQHPQPVSTFISVISLPRMPLWTSCVCEPQDCLCGSPVPMGRSD